MNQISHPYKNKKTCKKLLIARRGERLFIYSNAHQASYKGSFKAFSWVIKVPNKKTFTNLNCSKPFSRAING
ncbi:MAG: hypothetical protein ACYCSQ_05005 [bacterium]